ncbi:fatty acid desaturase [Chitinivibrio alkaliphilus]|nr:fatty acid desaturase [Chitinivibrio alkaliphilus]
MTETSRHSKLREARTHVPAHLTKPREHISIAYLLRDISLYILLVVLLWNTENIALLIPLWILTGLTISGLFVLGHDAAHGSFLQGKRKNYLAGQLAMIPSLHAFGQWVYGHNRVHHGHTAKIGADFIWQPVSPQEYRSYSPVKKVLHRIYWSPLGAGPYYLWEIWAKGMLLFTAPGKGVRRDKAIVLIAMISMITISVWGGGYTAQGYSLAAGGATFLRVFAIPFIIWNYIMGATVYVQHIHPNIAWRPGKKWTSFHGQIESTATYIVPAWYNFFLHNIYVHVPHHIHMKIPFYHLPAAYKVLKNVYGPTLHESNRLFRDYLKITKKCKLYAPSTEKWCTYKEATQA